MISLLRPVLLVALFVFAAPASALIIEVSDNENFSGALSWTDGGLGDDNALPGWLSADGTIGDWGFEVTGLSAPIAGDEYIDVMHLDSLDVTFGSDVTSTLYIRMTDTGFVGGSESNFSIAAGGVTGGQVSFSTYIDGTLVSSSGNISGSAFSFSDYGSVTTSDTYSMTIIAAVTHTGNTRTSFDYEIAVPEPGTLALLGIGLLGIGAANRRRSVS